MAFFQRGNNKVSKNVVEGLKLEGFNNNNLTL